MKLLLDQNIYDSTAQLLSHDGHDVVLAVQLGHARASDEALLSAADMESRILVTRDRDFGNLVHVGVSNPMVVMLSGSEASLVAEQDSSLRSE